MTKSKISPIFVASVQSWLIICLWLLAERFQLKEKLSSQSLFKICFSLDIFAYFYIIKLLAFHVPESKPDKISQIDWQMTSSQNADKFIGKWNHRLCPAEHFCQF